MNKHLKNFLHRGLMFGGFGPVVVGIVYLILSKSINDFSLNGEQMCLAIISTYILAFLQAGATVFNQIESWPVTKSLLYHFLTLYLAYTLCYLINEWIPFDINILLTFTLIFVAAYLMIWLTVYFIVRSNVKKLNAKIK